MRIGKTFEKILTCMIMGIIISFTLITSNLSLAASSYMMITGPYQPHYDRTYYNDKRLYGMKNVEITIEAINQTTLRGTAVNIDNIYYIDQEDLEDWIKDLNGKVDYVTPKVTPLLFEVNSIQYIDDHPHEDWHHGELDNYWSYSFTLEDSYKLIPLREVADFCGSDFNVTSDKITLKATEKPDTFDSYVDKRFISIDSSDVASGNNKINFKILAHTYNVTHNDAIKVGFTYKKDEESAPLTTLLDFSQEQAVDAATVKKAANGVITFEKDIVLSFTPEEAGVYVFYLKAGDGVDRTSVYKDLDDNEYVRTFYVEVADKSTDTVPSLPNITGKTLKEMQGELGIRPKHVGGSPAKPENLISPPIRIPDLRAPATEKIMFTVKYSTRGRGGCHSYDAPDMSYIRYKIRMGRDLQDPSKYLWFDNSTSGEMELCYYEKNWSTSSCCDGEPRTCSPVHYISSKKFTYRKIISIPKGAADDIYSISIKANDDRGNGPYETEVDFEVYTPLRTTFQLEKVLDEKYPDGQVVVNGN